jgi:hypothetical protein
LFIAYLPFGAGQFSPTAYAGHSLTTGAPCGCKEPNCAPDYPGECDGLQMTTQPTKGESQDYGSVVIMLAVAVLLWGRLRS